MALTRFEIAVLILGIINFILLMLVYFRISMIDLDIQYEKKIRNLDFDYIKENIEISENQIHDLSIRMISVESKVNTAYDFLKEINRGKL